MRHDYESCVNWKCGRSKVLANYFLEGEKERISEKQARTARDQTKTLVTGDQPVVNREII